VRAEFINPFVQSAFTVLKQAAATDVTRGQLALKGKAFLSREVTVAAGVVGAVTGQVFYSMSQKTALGIAGAMLGGMELASFDELARSAVSELANMITGNAMTLLAEAGIACNISPPTLVHGREVSMTTLERNLCIPVDTVHGEIEIIVGLEAAL
jgi:chemotaxis protein CheX